MTDTKHTQETARIISPQLPVESCLHHLFESQVERTPEAIAVTFTHQCLTYRELNEQANQLAHYLQSLGVGPDMPIGIFMERSLEPVIAVLGILKAGGAYVPLDPDYPTERLAFMLADIQAPIILIQSPLIPRLPAQRGKVVCLDAEDAAFAQEETTNLTSASRAEHLAYIIYTSGSTGRPKGVMITHRSLVSAYPAWQEAYQLGSGIQSHLQMAGISFDVFAEDMIRALCSGGKLVICPKEARLDPEQLYALMLQEEVNYADFVPTVLRNLVEYLEETGQDLTFMQRLIAGSDTWSGEEYRRCRRLCGPQTCLVNAYGLTETTIDSLYFESADGQVPVERPVPIGSPFAHVQTYILDAALSPVDPGTPGELYIGGTSLARGYVNHPALTAERFIPHAFSGEPGARLYRTGDLVRMLPDGNIELLGRLDTQVKIRGMRVELSEIEAVLRQHPGVLEALVLLKEYEEGPQTQKRLVAYIIPASSSAPSSSELRTHLKQLLPAHMIPALFVFLEAFPLSPNGKVDRRALSAPDWSNLDLMEPFQAPRNPLEEMLAGIWGQVLGVNQVGIFDNFFELGGHSLAAMRIIAQVRKTFQRELSLRRFFEAPTVAAFASILEHEALPGTQDEKLPPIQSVSRDAVIPLSFSQERVWFIQHLYPDILSYNTQTTHRLKGTLNIAALELSINEIARRHEILHTTFPSRDGQPVQVIHENQYINLEQIDLRTVPEAQWLEEAQPLIEKELRKPFTITQLPLIRWTLLRLSEQEHILILVEHHLVHDGWSSNVLLTELMTLYEAFAAGKPSPLPELPVQFADFACWQRQWLQGEVAERQLAYWRKKLAGSPPLLTLPSDRLRADVQQFRGAAPRVILPLQLGEALRTLSRKEGVTLFMTMLAAFITLLYRYTGQEDLCIGSSVANRRLPESENLLGMIVNNIVLRTNMAGNPSFRNLLKRVRQVTIEAYTHQDVPFDHVVKDLQIIRDLSYNPLFQVMFNFHDAPMPDLELPDLSISIEEALNNGFAKFDLDVVVIPRAEQYTGRHPHTKTDDITVIWEYNTDLFDEQTMARMLGHYQQLLASIVVHPEEHILDLPILTTSEIDQLVVQWNAPSSRHFSKAGIHQVFESQVEKTPNALALIDADQRLTYRELNRRANQVAHYLRTFGIQPDMPVGLYLHRSLEQIVGLLGILKAGGAYVPLDPASPQERLAFIMADARLPVLITQQQLVGQLPAEHAHVICLDTDWPIISQQSESNPSSEVGSDHLAYIIYTSGSTGTPKGVLIPHRAVLNHCQAAATRYELVATDRVLQFAPLTFDVAVEELFPTWSVGATVVLRSEEVAASFKAFHHFLEKEHVSVVNLPTSYWQEWVTDLVRSQESVPDTLHCVIVGSESALPERLAQWQKHTEKPIRWYHAYGLTEATVTSLVYEPSPEMTSSGGTTVPIGRPLAHTQVYLLDAHLWPVPIGVPGEVYIGGAGLARGYYHHPELTAERFLPNPFSQEPEARLYKTGDKARYLSDGNIEYLGRTDYQVKLRGYRIELGEIEAILKQHPLVQDAVLIIHEKKYLVAYITPSAEPPSLTSLRNYLVSRLPEYMLPSVLMIIDVMPLTLNGKVDRLALPPPGQERLQMEFLETYVAPQSPAECMLATIWSEVLDVDQIGIHDNFFQLGGHSLLITRVISRVREHFQVELPLRSLFEHPTIAELAPIIVKSQGKPENSSLSRINGDDQKNTESLLARLDQLSDTEVDTLFNALSDQQEVQE